MVLKFFARRAASRRHRASPRPAASISASSAGSRPCAGEHERIRLARPKRLQKLLGNGKTTWSASIVRVRRSFDAIQAASTSYLRGLSRAISQSSVHSAAPGHPESSWDRASMARLQAARRFTATGLEPEDSMVPAGSTALGKRGSGPDGQLVAPVRPSRSERNEWLGAGRAHVSGNPALRRHSSIPGAESIKEGMCA